MAGSKSANNDKGGCGLYTLDVVLFSGPVTEKFAKKNPVVSYIIEIRGDQTLEQLHKAIFKAFDRWEGHMYEFQVGGKGPQDRKARRYTLKEDEWSGSQGTEGRVRKTTIASLGLKKDQSFGYWFDFGDDWWHQINVVKISADIPQGRYPKITNRIGQSPPQYADSDEQDQ
ncbi:MAG: plasmid pRiA4b ORF-3 family protein [Planctomycetota bacterium]